MTLSFSNDILMNEYAKEEEKIMKHKSWKTRSILPISIIIILIISIILPVQVQASQVKEPISDKLNRYPGYMECINNLKAQHPNWNFTILYTGLEWSQVLTMETTAQHTRSLVYKDRGEAWFCPICGNTPQDNGNWVCASEAAVAYMMDPRNWLNESDLFQFEDLSFNGEVQNIQGVQKILEGVNYMQGDTIVYTTTSGEKATIHKSYAQVIMEQAQAAGISPYHLAARIRQEQGTGNSPSPTASGTYSGFIGYYNFLNIKASGSGNEAIIRRALTEAQNQGWDTPEKSIAAGAEFLAAHYISKGQNCLYLQKFDVDSSDGNLYWNQYMQNIEAAKNEGNTVRSSYEKMGFLNNDINFIIPVYENMPDSPSPIPGSDKIVTQDVKVTARDVQVKSEPTPNAQTIGTFQTGDIVLRIEISSNCDYNGIYWDKITMPNGEKAYIPNCYIEQVADICNTNEKMITNTSVNLRNGPGTQGTTIIATLASGQPVTKIETGKYNGLDGYDWDRVVLADGRSGYMASRYLNTNGTEEKDIVKVVASALKVRAYPGTDQEVLTVLSNGEEATRIEKNSATKNGFVWDKIVTASGITGYVARYDSQMNYIEPIQNGNENNGNQGEEIVTSDQMKVDGDWIVCVPEFTVDGLKQLNPSAVIENTANGRLSTGSTVKVWDKTYTVIKVGDVNKDGNVNTLDALSALRCDVGSETPDAQQILALDVDRNSKFNTVDALTLLKYDVGTAQIKL